MDDYLAYYVYNNNNNDNENNNIDNMNNDNDPPSNNSEKISAIFILSVAICLIIIDLLSLYYSYDYILYSSKKYPFETFDKCIKYQSITEIFFTFFAFMAAVSVGIMAIGVLVGYELFFEKFLVTFFNLNYYIFGLLLFTSSLLGLYNYNRVCYDCIKKNPDNSEFNISTMICLIFISIIGGGCIFIFSSSDSFEYVCNCIRFNKDGNYFLGRAFWKYALARNNERQNAHERSD